jgi:acyl-coenzyme A thioesterase PaaI-like protein
MEKQPNSRMCFVCGIENPIGLKLKFYTDDEGRCIARFQPKPEHQGSPGHLHGGLISTLLYIAMKPVYPMPPDCQVKHI